MKYILILATIFLFYIYIPPYIPPVKDVAIIEKPIIKPVTKVIASVIQPKLNAEKSVEINLTKKIIELWDGGKIIQTLPIAYQAKEGKWFQTPTGYFRTGIKDKDKISSLVGVSMPYSVQLYEDFFIHEIPSLNGKKLTSEYTGGCIRLETEDAKSLFDFTEPDMPMVVYKDFGMLKPQYHAPVNLDQFWIRQNFNNPIRQTHKYGGNIDKIGLDYIQHTGVDLAPNSDVDDLGVYAIADGNVVGIWENGDAHGLGNTIIINHGEFYALYAHLNWYVDWYTVKKEMAIKKGQIIGGIGNTGYGCNYWRIGEDGCESENPPDNHLHLEIKEKPVLENPPGEDIYYGYTPTNPTNYGYMNPLEILFK